MRSTTDLLNSIQVAANGLTLADLLTANPGIARRTAQRLIAKLIASGQVTAEGEGRARRYFGVGSETGTGTLPASADRFPRFIALSADSKGILAYIDQPPEARKPVARADTMASSWATAPRTSCCRIPGCSRTPTPD